MLPAQSTILYNVRQLIDIKIDLDLPGLTMILLCFSKG